MKPIRLIQVAMLLCMWSLQAIAQTPPSVFVSSGSGNVGQVAPVDISITYTANPTVVAFQVELSYDNANLTPDLSFCDPGPTPVVLDLVSCSEPSPGTILVIVENAVVLAVADQLQIPIPFDISTAAPSPPPYDILVVSEKYVDNQAATVPAGVSTPGSITVSLGPQPDWSPVGSPIDWGTLVADTGPYPQFLTVTNIGEAGSTLLGNCYLASNPPAVAFDPFSIIGDKTLGAGLAKDESQQFEIHFDTTGLPPGPYSDTLVCEHNGNAAAGAPTPVNYPLTAFVRANQVIDPFTANPPSPGIVDGNSQLSATASSGLPVTFSSLTENVCTTNLAGLVTYLIGGTCTVAANQAGDDLWFPAPQVTLNITVNKLDQTITGLASDNDPGGVDETGTLSATASSGLDVSFGSDTPSVCTVAGSTVSYLTAGTCTITADQAGDDRYNAAPQESIDVTVEKADQTINNFAAAPDPGTMDGSSTLSATATSGLPVVFDSDSPSVCTVAGNVVTYLAVGTCNLTADQLGDDNYNPAPQVTLDVTVNKANQTITGFVSDPGTGGVDDTTVLSATASSGLPVVFDITTPDICSISGNVVTLLDLGDCIVTANQAGNENYNAAPQVSITITVIDATSIPTLSQWGMLLMFLMLLGLGGFVIRRETMY